MTHVSACCGAPAQLDGLGDLRCLRCCRVARLSDFPPSVPYEGQTEEQLEAARRLGPAPFYNPETSHE